VLQTRLSTKSQKQRVPLFDGVGLVQSRVLLDIPPPQLTVQLFQFNQELQFPFTKTRHVQFIYNM